jgi:anti-sigma factor RsiW
MMTCRECAELLLEYLTEELDAERREAIRQHLEECPPCVVYIETYQTTIRLTSQLTCVDLPPDVAERLWTAMDQAKD